MTRRLYLGDVNNVSPAWYDVSFWVPGLDKLDEKVHAYGQGAQLDFDVWAEREGQSIPILPKSGMEVLYYDHNAGNPLLHKYLVGGRISVDFPTPVPEDKRYRIEVDGFEEDFTLIIPYTIFYQSAYPNDSGRVTALIQDAAASFGLKGTWDTTSFVGGPFITYKPGSYNDYNLKSIAYILADIASDPGQPTDPLYKVPARRFFVSCQWADPANPGTGGVGALVRVMNYYSGSRAIQEPVPLTDRPDGMAYYAYDTFTRANSTSSLGTSETGQDWAALVGTWGITGNKAYLAAHTSGEDAAVLASTVGDGEVQATLSTVAGNQRLLFRLTSLPAQPYKWEGWVLENNGGASYRLRKFQAGAFTNVATYAVTPANGDVVKVVLSSSTITVYINGVAQTPVVDAFNQTAALHGIGQSGGSIARFDNFSVWGRGARFYKLRTGNDRTPMINIVTIAGPGSDPAPVSWQNFTGTQGQNDGDLTKTAATDAWDAGASGSEAIDEDGGAVTATSEQVRKVWDSFDRVDNTAVLGTAPSGQAWALLGTGAVAGVTGNKGYFSTGTGPLYAYIDSGVATCISEVKLSTVATGARLLFRMTDANNLWFVDAFTSYKIYKRVAGVETLMGTYAVTPANGDVVKVSCEDNVIKLYINGAGPGITITDSFNQTATKHGFGTASVLTARYDDFSVWQTYAEMAFGIGPTTTITHYNQIAFGWKINAAARTAQPTESGTLVGSAVAYVQGDRFKVAVRPVVSGGGIVGYQVRYYKNDVPQFLSAQNPAPSTATPFHAQGAIFHRGATISNVTIKLFSYSTFANDTSIGKWGPKAANTLIKRDDLDTREKRQAMGDAILARHPDPHQTIDLDTLQEYGEGHIVLLNSAKMGWQNYRQVVATMKRNLGPQDRVLYHLQVGEADIEWGDDDPLGYMLQSQIEDRTAPQPPTNLAASQGVPDSATTVTHNFTWDLPHGDERWLWLTFSPLGGPAFERRLPAQSGLGTVPGLPAATPYRVRPQYEDWNRNRSDYGTAIDIVTANLPQLPPPGSLTETTNQYNDIMDLSQVSWSWTAPADPFHLGLYGYKVVLTQNGVSRILPNIGLPLGISLLMEPGQPYIFAINAIDQNGRDGAVATISGTAAVRVHDTLLNPSFENIQRVPQPINPDGWTLDNGTGLGSKVVWDVSTASEGSHSIQFQHPNAGTVPSAYSDFVRLDPKRTYAVDADVKGSAGDAVGPAYDLEFYVAPGGSPVSTVSGNFSPLTTSWVSVHGEGGRVPPPTAQYGRLKLKWGGSARSLTQWIDNIRLRAEVPTVDLKNGAVDGTKLASSIDYAGTFKLLPGASIVAKAVNTSGGTKYAFQDQDGTEIGDLQSIGRASAGGGGIRATTHGLPFTTDTFKADTEAQIGQPNGTPGSLPARVYVGGANGDVTPNIQATDSSSTRVFEVGAKGQLFNSTSLTLAGIVTKSATFTADDLAHIYLCNSASAITANLPAASGLIGRIYTFININSGTVTIDGSGSETIDGITTYPLQGGRNSVTIVCTGAGWYVKEQGGLILQSDGTRWLGPRIAKTEEFAQNSGGNATNYSGTTLNIRTEPPTNESYYISKVTWWVRVNTTNNGSNYWTLRLGHEGNTFGGAVDLDVNTSALTAGTPKPVSGSPNTVRDFSDDTNNFTLFLEVRKDNGSPGTLDVWSVGIEYRRIYS